jgi:hypothetical protein
MWTTPQLTGSPDTQRVRSQPSGQSGPELSRTLDQNCLRTGPMSVDPDEVMLVIDDAREEEIQRQLRLAG